MQMLQWVAGTLVVALAGCGGSSGGTEASATGGLASTGGSSGGGSSPTSSTGDTGSATGTGTSVSGSNTDGMTSAPTTGMTTDPTATTSTMADAKLTQQGDLGPRFPSAAVVLSSGKILSSDGGVFRVLDPSAAAPRWERFGKTMMGQQIRYRPSLTEDPTTGEVLVFGGASTNASPTSSTLSILSKDGDTLTKADVPDGPAGRASHGAALVGRSLVIAGGYVGSGVSGALYCTWTELHQQAALTVDERGGGVEARDLALARLGLPAQGGLGAAAQVGQARDRGVDHRGQRAIGIHR